MSTTTTLPPPSQAWVPPVAEPLDEAKWQSWRDKGRADEQRSNDRCIMAVKIFAIATLLATAALSSLLAPYGLAVRFVVTVSAIVVMVQAIRTRYYIAAAAFAALVLLYNPVVPAISFSETWQLVLMAVSTLPFVASLFWRAARTNMYSRYGMVVALAFLPTAALAEDLSKYRSFQLGADIATINKLTGTDPSQTKVIHRRPALIQELEWRPRSLGSPSETEPAKEMVFTFYNGDLFRMVINYDRYETEGMTASDLVEAISATYGVATKPIPETVTAPERYGNQEQVVAQWQDSQYRFELIRSSYGPAFRLVGLVKRLETPVQTAVTEAARLDDKEAPQREAERTAREAETERDKLEKARSVNKAKFRP
jgi:hypothetical protein